MDRLFSTVTLTVSVSKSSFPFTETLLAHCFLKYFLQMTRLIDNFGKGWDIFESTFRHSPTLHIY